VDLDFTPEQDLLRDSVRRTVERHGGLDAVRKLENDPIGYSPALWSGLGELGVLGITIPEQYGGTGAGLLDAAVVYEEFGRSLVPSPHLVSCVLAAGLIARSPDTAVRDRLLPGLASGSSIATVASLEPNGGFGPAGVQLRAVRDGNGWRLSGTKAHVPFAAAAQWLLVLARTGPGVDPADLIAVLVATTAPGVGLDQQQTIAADAQFSVTFEEVRVEAADVVHQVGAAWPAWHDTMLDAVTLIAAQAAGGARAALDLAVGYAGTREQFGRPLAGFQAISHYLADSATAVDGAQTLAWQAAWARSEGDPAVQLAAMAKSFACRTFRDVTATAQQIFGGNGFTVDFDIQLYFRRAKSLQLTNWDTRYLNELIAAELLS
jgi:alkylation response protein AidB-like acyl-CoA dehydrogenase